MAKGKVLKTIIDISGEISPTLGKSLNSVVDKLEGVNLKAIAVAASVTAIGGAVAVDIGKATKYLADLGTEYDKASNQMAASTGLVGDELANMEKQMQDVYGNNFGEDMQDVSEGMAEVYRQTKLTGDALQGTTEGAFALRDVFGYDIPETARAAKAMMENFGISGEEAMSLIAAGAQNGLDYSGELIDTINEYSVHFEQLGFSVDDMFHIFQQGTESGAWSLNVVGDAIKEFSILSIDGSENTITAFKELGLNAEEMMATFAGGGANAEAAFRTVIDSLTAIDDAVKQDEIGVSLFGSKWEDMSVDAIAALADIDSSAYDTGKALEGISNIKYNDLDSAIQGIKRTFETAMLPAAESVTEAIIEIAPEVEEMVAEAGPFLADLAEKIGPAIEKAIELGEKGFRFVKQTIEETAPIVKDFADNGIAWLKNNMDWLIPVVSGLAAAIGVYSIATSWAAIVTGIETAALWVAITALDIAAISAKVFGAAMAFITSPITWVAVAIGAVVAAGIWMWQNWDIVKEKAAQLGAWLSQVWQNIKAKCVEVWTSVKTWISTKWSEISSKTSEIWSSIVSSLSGWWQGLVSKVSGIWSNIVSTVSSYWGQVRSTTQSIWSGIVSTLQGIWNGLVTKVKNMVTKVKTALQNGWSKLTSILTAPFDKLKGVIDGVLEKVNGLIDKINGLTGLDIPTIPGKAKGGFTNGLTFAGEDPSHPVEAVISFNPAYRDQNLAYWAQAGRMLGADYSDYSLGGDSGGVYYDLGGVVFAPNINISGNADRRTIMDAIEDEYPEFLDFLDEYLMGRGKPVYV